MIDQGDYQNLERRLRFNRPQLRRILEKGDHKWQVDLIKYGLSIVGSIVLLTPNKDEFAQTFILFQKIENCTELDTTKKINFFENQLQHFALSQQDALLQRQVQPSPIVNEAIKFISDNLYSHLRPHQIAKEVHVTTAYLNQLIQTVRNQTTKQLINEMKVQEGARLLSYSELPIREIASLLRFSDSSHFTNSFKSVYSVPPTVYRRKHSYV